MRQELEQVTFRRIEAPTTQGAPQQVWEMLWKGKAFAKAEVWEGETQWGVRLVDSSPQIATDDLRGLVSKLLIWEIGCKADTVELVLGRDASRQTMVNVGGEYV